MRTIKCTCLVLCPMALLLSCAKPTLQEGRYEVAENNWATFVSTQFHKEDSTSGDLGCILLIAALDVLSSPTEVAYQANSLYITTPTGTDTLSEIPVIASKQEAINKSQDDLVIQPLSKSECDVWFGGQKVMHLCRAK